MVHFATFLVSGLLAVAYAGPIAVSDAESALEVRATTVLCKPKLQDPKQKDKKKWKTMTFKVDADKSSAQAKAAGFTDGKSSYPHHFGNSDKIKWGVGACDKPSVNLMEYPVFADTVDGKKIPKAQTEWKKDGLVKDQDKTPVRAVFANANGGFVFCGVMTHKEVTSTREGKDGFMKCS